MKGLSVPINVISFEYTPGFIDATFNCVNQLNRIGIFEFNYSIGETMKFALEKWVNGDDICQILKSLKNDDMFGDIYAKFIGVS